MRTLLLFFKVFLLHIYKGSLALDYRLVSEMCGRHQEPLNAGREPMINMFSVSQTWMCCVKGRIILVRRKRGIAVWNVFLFIYSGIKFACMLRLSVSVLLSCFIVFKISYLVLYIWSLILTQIFVEIPVDFKRCSVSCKACRVT